MDYLSAFIAGTTNVLHTMAHIEATVKEIHKKKNFRIYGDVSGVIGLSGEVEGSVAVTFPWNLAQEIISRMMKVPVAELTPEVIHDGVGELINMVSGTAKTSLAGTPYYFLISLPTIIVGLDHEIGYPPGENVAAIIFNVGNESFTVQVSIIPRKKDK